MNKYVPSSSKKKSLARTWDEFRSLAVEIRGQTALLRAVRTNSAMDMPSAWLSQIENLRQALVELHQEVLEKANAIPDGAHPAVIRQRDSTLQSLEIEFRALHEQLFGGIQHVQSMLNDPLRTSTDFSGGFLDYLSVTVDFLDKVLRRRKDTKKK